MAIADVAKGAWPDIARNAAVELVRARKQISPSLGIRLLADCKTVFTEERLPTQQVLHRLVELPELIEA